VLRNQQILISTFLLALDLVGTFVFALSGAAAGIKHRLDLFGVLVLSFAAANAGGITRDLLIGAVPPAGISDWRYMAVSAFAGLSTFAWTRSRAPSTLATRVADWPRLTRRLAHLVLVLDAAGLALFAVTGAVKALAFQLAPAAAILLGVTTGIGGGVLRDLLVAEVPTVLRAELYAVAALAGAAVVVVGRQLGITTPALGIVGATLCFTLRILAIQRGWRLPTAHRAPPSSDS
jgi:uncharacterized membrane protein YeiH